MASSDQLTNVDVSCDICCELFSSPNHQIASLKCGHVFGKRCIERWLSRKESRKRCPHCNQTSDLRDIRIIYFQTLSWPRDSQLDKMKNKLDQWKKRFSRQVQKLEDLTLELVLKESKISALESELNTCAVLGNADESRIMRDDCDSMPYFENCRFEIDNRIRVNYKVKPILKRQSKLNKKPLFYMYSIDLFVRDCNLIVVSEVLQMIIIAQPTASYSAVTGFGIRCFPTNNYIISDFIFLHTCPIEDMALHPNQQLLLTFSGDCFVKVTNLETQDQIVRLDLSQVRPMCICWNEKMDDLFYVGLADGCVLEARKSDSEIVKRFDTKLNAPIKFIRFLNHNLSNDKVNLFIATHQRSYICELKFKCRFTRHLDLRGDEIPKLDLIEDEIPTLKPLLVAGPVISSSTINQPDGSGDLLITVRLFNDDPKIECKHYVFEFNFNLQNTLIPPRFNCDLVKKIVGGVQIELTRSRIFAHPDKANSFFMCSVDEEAQGTLLWEEEEEMPTEKIKVLANDMALYRPSPDEKPILAVLNDRYLRLYQCV